MFVLSDRSGPTFKEKLSPVTIWVQGLEQACWPSHPTSPQSMVFSACLTSSVFVLICVFLGTQVALSLS